MADQEIPSEPVGGSTTSIINVDPSQWGDEECGFIPNAAQLLHGSTSLVEGTPMGDFK